MREQQLMAFYILLWFLNLIFAMMYAYAIFAKQQLTRTHKSWTFNLFIVT